MVRTPWLRATATASAPPCPSRVVACVAWDMADLRSARRGRTPGSFIPPPGRPVTQNGRMSETTYAVWGWGGPGEAPGPAELEALAPTVQAVLGFAVQPPERPAPLRPLASDTPLDRARHGLGRSYRDIVRGLRGHVQHPPDLVLRPRGEAEVAAALDWCGDGGVALVPFGGGTSVVGGVEPAVGDGFAGVVSLDLGVLSGVAEVDPVARAARVLAGTLGPVLEEQLAPHGLTLRFFPQSFERSTVGGWLATRAAGHFATGPTHVDDLVESIRMVTPAGTLASRRVSPSGRSEE